ncbi:MAG: mannose-1-phosphate guanylyltransferase/mannose-6-phosphate isomerase [Rhodocyclales bacterium GWA2_65_20]|nr:MAG: mannose-1-phosphate guanylyltransferase/mannose-6-phosphate isomerase [Rhodocyclales bacterium GWA2_65_20]
MNIYPVILCGGAGTRLWPLSRESHPKQFLPLLRGRSPFQATLERLQGIADARTLLIVANQEHRFTVRDQVQAAGARPYRLYVEPCGRGTAPAVAVAACQLVREDPDAAMLILPADHDIPDHESFRHAVALGEAALHAQRLVVFGLAARRPETGYGYIERGESLAGAEGCYRVAHFVEKPELEIARSFVASGRHYWNSGIFLFGAAHFLAELDRLEPELAAACRNAAATVTQEHDCRRIGAEAFARCRSISIDHAVLERTDAAAMVAATFPWSDIGSWHALWDVADKDAHGNVTQGDVHLYDVEDSYVHSSRRVVVGIGLKNLVIVETADALLVATRENTQHVKEAVELLRAQERDECRTHLRVNRPWGHYEDVDGGERFRVKRITVNPGARLSLQLHHHRAEHWVVVRGTARVTRGDEVVLLCENQSTYIPVGVAHRLENPGKIPLEVIETQSGSYLKEDDIVRLQDAYHRV